MKTKPFDAEELNLITLAREYSDEDKARGLLEKLRWPNGVVCPHCASVGEEYKITAKPTSKRPSRNGLYCCGICRKQFSVTVGTIFEDSHLPISKWLMAIFILCSSKKSVSANQIHRMLGITYKSAWFMCHRIRYAMGSTPNMEKLKNIVEVDETYVGGKGELKTVFKRKTPVIALVERDGNMKTAVVANVTQKNLGKVLHEVVSKDAHVNTDEHGGYRNPLKEWKRHTTVVHSKYEYARTEKDGTVSHINTCESFFSLLKRGVYGSWHHVSREHLPKYAGEFEFRWNHRKVSDGERMVAAVNAIEGKRLTYRQVI